jgi:DNA-binding NarL/FixJ family response regulator
VKEKYFPLSVKLCGDTAGANGYLIMDRASEELATAIKTVAAGGLYLSPGIAGLVGRLPS